MSDGTDGRRAKTTESPSADSVRAYIERNPAILASLIAPNHSEQPGVIDIQRYVVNGLRRSLEQSDARERQILAAAEDRAHAVDRVHGACRTAIGAVSLDDLVYRVAREFPIILEIDDAALITRDRVPPSQFKALNRRLGTIRLGTPGDTERTVLGEHIQSVAIIALGPAGGTAPAILLLGSKDPHGFDSEKGTELLEFLGEIIRFCIERWSHPQS